MQKKQISQNWQKVGAEGIGKRPLMLNLLSVTHLSL
jgi:hypothetical protein